MYHLIQCRPTCIDTDETLDPRCRRKQISYSPVSYTHLCTAALYYKEYIIATGTGLVFGAQVINIIKWKRD